MIKRVARFASRKWPQPIYDLRRELGLQKGANPLFDAKHSPQLVLAMFSSVLGTAQKDWPSQYADYGILLLRFRRGQCSAAGAP